MKTSRTIAFIFLAFRGLRRRSVRRSLTIVVAVFALLGSVFVCISAFTLTRDQQADREFGEYDNLTYTDINLGELKQIEFSNLNSALKTAIPTSHVLIKTPQLAPDLYAKTFVKASIPIVRFIEDAELGATFPNRYGLSSGSWPERAFDVVISPHLARELGTVKQFTVLSGRATFHIVGMVNDSYAQESDLIVAAPGTWESLPQPPVSRLYQPVGAQLTVFWDADQPLSTVAGILATALPKSPDDDRATGIENNYATRDAVAGDTETGFGSQNIVISYLPLFILAMSASIYVAKQTRVEVAADADRIVSLGIQRNTSRFAQASVLCVAFGLASAAGLCLGWALGISLRVTILPQYAEQPLSRLPGVDSKVLGIYVSSLLLITLVLLWPDRTALSGRSFGSFRPLDVIRFDMIRRAASVVLYVVAVKIDRQTESDTVLTSYSVAMAVILLTPDLLSLVLLTLPWNRPRTLVTRRLLARERGRVGLAGAALACCVAVPICAATQITSQTLSRVQGSYSLIPAHQLWIQSGAGVQGVSEVGSIVSQVAEAGRPIVIRGLSGQDRRGKSSAVYAHFLNEPTSGNHNSRTLVLASASDLSRLVGAQSTTEFEQTLNAGGVLDFTGAIGNQQFVIDSESGGRKIVPNVLPTLKVSLALQFSEQYAGVILLSTATNIGLPVSDPVKYIFTDASDAFINRAVAEVVNQGYDARFVQYSVLPPPPDIPASWYIFLSGLLAGGFVVLLLVLRAQAAKLRSYSARLLSIGLTPRWILSILGIQAAVIVGSGVIVGVVAGVLGVEVVTDNYLVLDVPVLPIVIAGAVTILASGFATASTVRALNAVESPEIN